MNHPSPIRIDLESLLLQVCVICRSIGNWEIAIYHRFVVGGYVRKCVEVRISIGSRAVALASGIERVRFVDSYKLSTSCSSCSSPSSTSPLRLLRRSGHPLSSWYQISSVSLVSIHISIHRFRFVFDPIQKKPKKKLGLEFAIA